MSLVEELEKVYANQGYTPEIEKLIREVQRKVIDSGVAPGLEIGERAPDFTLSDPDGNPVSLQEQLKAGHVILNFINGDWCPFSTRELELLQSFSRRFEESHTRLITIINQSTERLKKLREKLDITFTLLSDPDQKVISSFKLQYTLPEELRTIYPNLEDESANHSWKLPIPSTFLIGRDGVVRERFSSLDFTRRLEPEQLLGSLNNLSYFESIFKNALIPLTIVNPEGVVIDHNPALNNLFGESHEHSIVGVNLVNNSLFEPGFRKILKEVLAGHSEYGEVKKTTIQSRNGDGACRIVNSTISPLNVNGQNIGAIVVYNDITENVNLVERVSMMARFAQENPSPVMRFNCQGEIVMANPAAQEVFELSSPQGGSIAKIMKELQIEERQWKELITRGATVERGCELNDKHYYFVVKGLPHWEVGHIYGADITEVKRTERLREDVERVVKHDLKNPIAGMISYADLLLDEELTDEQRAWVITIQNSGYDVLHMIEHSLDLFKMEEGTYRLTPEPVNMIKVFKNLDREFDSLKNQFGISISYKLGADDMDFSGSYQVSGEIIHLQSLFANLIRNAIEASAKGDKVTVTIHSSENLHCFTIHNPAEIPAEIQKSFFERYVTGGKPGGTGLGTYSARLLARAHGGDITFKSSSSEGTILTVTLPG